MRAEAAGCLAVLGHVAVHTLTPGYVSLADVRLEVIFADELLRGVALLAGLRARGHEISIAAAELVRELFALIALTFLLHPRCNAHLILALRRLRHRRCCSSCRGRIQGDVLNVKVQR